MFKSGKEQFEFEMQELYNSIEEKLKNTPFEDKADTIYNNVLNVSDDLMLNGFDVNNKTYYELVDKEINKLQK